MTNDHPKPRLVIGCGYLGLRVAKLWRDSGDVVYAVSRSRQRADRLREEEGLKTIVGDVLDPASLADLPEVASVLFAVGYSRTSEASIHEVYVEGLRNVLDALPAASGPVVYISSTGVYAQKDGQWVDEDSECEPDREGGRACLAAEQCLVAHLRGAGATILRMAGIYGPGRLPRSLDLIAGHPIPAPADGYLNLIHVDDAARIVVAAAKRTGPIRTYLVSDGSPTTREEYFKQLACQLNAPPPQFEQHVEDPPRRARGTSSKRVSNQRVAEELDYELNYPSYCEGLAGIVGEGGV